MNKATQRQSKEHNTRLVLKTIYDHGQISRADIARITQLTRPTISLLVAELMADDWVVEVGHAPSGGGKPPILLEVAHDAYQLISLDLGSTEFRAARVNLRGDILDRRTFQTDGEQGEDALAIVYDLIDDLLKEATAPILGIGLGTPGLVNPEDGVIIKAVNLGWSNVPIRDLLMARYEKPVYVANDSQAAALAEYTFGNKNGSDHLVVIKIGQGIGAGIVLDGQIYYGDGFGAGEIGHVVVANNGTRCRCGNIGCLETTSSTRAILSHAAHNVGRPLNWDEIVTAWDEKQTAVTLAVLEAGQYLGVALANLISSFNMHHILISGRVVQFGDRFLEAARKEAQRRVLPTMVANTTIEFAALGRDIVLLGSTAMVLKQELGII